MLYTTSLDYVDCYMAFDLSDEHDFDSERVGY